jgi:hypothetical protein
VRESIYNYRYKTEERKKVGGRKKKRKTKSEIK